MRCSIPRAGFAACLLVSGGVLLSSCRSPTGSPGSTVPGSCEANQPLIEPAQTDILFVIDNSQSMEQEQEGVASELQAFIDVISRGGGVAQDFHVGVVTTSVYLHVNNGTTTDQYPVFPLDGSESGHLASVDVGNGPEYVLHGDDPQLLQKFQGLVRRGIAGSGQETAFEAARRALSSPLIDSPPPAGTQGFLRDGARLLIVVLTDEDDCSEMDWPSEVIVGVATDRDYCNEQSANLDTVDAYYQFFTNLTDSTGQRKEVLWAAIAPVARSTKVAQGIVDNGFIRNFDCPTSHAPGHRHRAMAERFDTSLSNLDSICNASYHDSLVTIAGIASAGQSIEVQNVPDPRLLTVEIVRRQGERQMCTVAAGDLTYEPPVNPGDPGILRFGPTCQRRGDDQALTMKMICAG